MHGWKNLMQIISRWNCGQWGKMQTFFTVICASDLKYSFQGFDSSYQHSNKSKHKSLSNLRFGNSCRRFLTEVTTVSVDKPSPSSSPNYHITFDPILKEKVAVSEALWVFEVAQDALSLSACDGISSVFQKFFSWFKCGKITYYEQTKGIICFAGWIRSIAITMACYKT